VGSDLRFFSALLLSGLLALTMAGCAKPVSHTSLTAGAAASRDDVVTGGVARSASARMNQAMPNKILGASQLAGRTLEVASTSEIVLRPGEVILTFDDGPRAGKTSKILDALDRYGVKGTFLMLGSAAAANPALAREVALRGHTVGSHTYDHTNLANLSRQAALDEIARGEAAVAEALGGADMLSPFFRFPYLAQTGFLRTSLLHGDMVVLDVDIDSKDYYKESAQSVANRTLDRLEARGSGIILFHDIHQRTVDLLPDFLAELEARGYSVVRLVPKAHGIFGRSIITADVTGL